MVQQWMGEVNVQSLTCSTHTHTLFDLINLCTLDHAIIIFALPMHKHSHTLQYRVCPKKLKCLSSMLISSHAYPIDSPLDSGCYLVMNKVGKFAHLKYILTPTQPKTNLIISYIYTNKSSVSHHISTSLYYWGKDYFYKSYFSLTACTVHGILF